MTTKDEALARKDEQELVAAQHRFRHPQKGMPGWSSWQQATVNHMRPTSAIDSVGYEVEYRLLYTAPPKRKPLSDEEIREIADNGIWAGMVFADGTKGIALDKVTVCDFARAIEAAHGIGVNHETFS